MSSLTGKRITLAVLVSVLGLASFFILRPNLPIQAADHTEATLATGDPGADIGDIFAFLDPNDNSKVVLAMDVQGFVVPSELLNLSSFSPEVVYRFYIENTGDARPDQTIDVTF